MGAKRAKKQQPGASGSQGEGGSTDVLDSALPVGGAQVPRREEGERLETRNEVVLAGRMAAAPAERELPSGDVITTWRLIVDRPPLGRPPPDQAPRRVVDTLDCVAWDAETRRSARDLVAGDVVSVTGALRRRFWRGGSGAVSRCEVEVVTLQRLRSVSS